jgi:CRISPR-associated protein Cmr5
VSVDTAPPQLLRDQRRALQAYRLVRDVPGDQATRRDYKTAVDDLVATILRHGLSAGLAGLERKSSRSGGLVLGHLAACDVPGLAGATEGDLPAQIRTLDVDSYMIATREILQLAAWFRRAVQATFEDEGG